MKPGALPDMVMGNAKAPVTIIEYASMTCPHCAHFQETTFPELKKRYIDTGKVRYIFREFPLDNLAAAAFMLARCAGELDSGKYYAMIDTMFAQQRTWAVEKPIPPLMAIAKQAGFTEKTFDACLANQKILAGIEGVRQRAIKEFQVELDADLLHQRQAHGRRPDDRRHGQDHRPDAVGRRAEPNRARWPAGRRKRAGRNPQHSSPRHLQLAQPAALRGRTRVFGLFPRRFAVPRRYRRNFAA